MKQIKIINHIAESALEILKKNGYTYGEEIDHPDGIFMRSEEIHHYPFPDSLLVIARAGVGVNNIPVSRCTKQGIAVFNTPGANANAVKEMTLLGLLAAVRYAMPAYLWTQTLKGKEEIPHLCEQHKKAFKGYELKGKTLGIIGVGRIGSAVGKAAVALGMRVFGNDPYLSKDQTAALEKEGILMVSKEKLLKSSDYITLHLPCNAQTKEMISKRQIELMKSGVCLLNFARGELVVAEEVAAAVKAKKISCYVSDFCTDSILNIDGIITFPHLGGSTFESEETCAHMAAVQMMEYLAYGNVKNSVNLPDLFLEPTPWDRLCVIHENKKGLLFKITEQLESLSYNIEDLFNRSKGEVAYTVVDISAGKNPKELKRLLMNIPEIYRIRLLGSYNLSTDALSL